MDNKLYENKLNSEKVYDGKLLKVYCDNVQLPDNKFSTREYIKHNGAVCIVPITASGKVIIEKQFRYPFGEVITEIPAGKLDSADEDHLEAAKRELKEETGYSASKWTYLGEFAPTVAYSTEIIYMYLAQDLKKGTTEPDEDEFIAVEEVPFQDIVADILKGKIKDGKTIAAVLKVNSLPLFS